MPKVAIRNPNNTRSGGTKYDAHHKVLSQTYGAFADLRRELSDSKETVGGREEILKNFAACPDSQRSWLLLEDYFEKLLLSRKDFPDTNWWPKLLNATGKERLEELAFVFLRAKRSVPPELQPHASLDRFAKAEEAEQEVKLVQELENWLSPPAMPLLDTPRATLRVVCRAQPDETEQSRHRLAVQFLLSRPRTGEKARTLREMIDLVVRATHEQELFPPHDWEFIQWIADTHRNRSDGNDTLILSDGELLQWIARWGNTNRLEFSDNGQPLQFHGQIISLAPHLENGDKELSFTHRFNLPGGENHSVAAANFFNHQPPLALVGNTFFLLRNAPPSRVLKYLAHKPSVPVRKLSHRLLLHLRKTQSNGADWSSFASRTRPRRNLFLNCSTTRFACACLRKANAIKAFGSGTEMNLSPTTQRSVRTTNRKFSTTRGSNQRLNGFANSTGSRPNPDCGSATRMKIFSVLSPRRGRRV